MSCTVLVDSREYSSAIEVIKWLKRFGCIIVPKPLEVGDYVLSGDVGVERKRAMDFLNSIIDGRLFEQVSQLRNTYNYVMVIIEGDLWGSLESRNIHKHSVIGAMASLTRLGASVVNTPDPEGTAFLLYSITKSSRHGGVRSPVKRKMGIREAQVAFLSSLPGIGARRAEKLLEVFGNPMNALNNLNQWSRKIDGISEGIISRIRKILLTPREG